MWPNKHVATLEKESKGPDHSQTRGRDRDDLLNNKRLNPKLLERHGLRSAFSLIRRDVGQLLRDLVLPHMTELALWRGT